jgi:hypothetical protein
MTSAVTTEYNPFDPAFYTTRPFEVYRWMRDASPVWFEPTSEVLGLMMVLFLGGVESTAGLIGSMLKLLADLDGDPEFYPSSPNMYVWWRLPARFRPGTST